VESVSNASVRISLRHVTDEIEKHALEAYPEECCGFLLGAEKGGTIEITGTQSVENTRGENRTHRYLITPEQFLQAEVLADNRGCELVGGYHSHPDHPAVPSQYDLEHALPGFVYLILSVREGRLEAWRWWMLTDNHRQFDELQFKQISKEE